MPGQAWLAGRGASALKVGRAWLGSCCGLLLVAALDRLAVGDYGVPMLIGSFGASAVLLFAAPDSPLSRPRNLLGGHFFSALVGVACAQWLPPFWAVCLCRHAAERDSASAGRGHGPYRRHRRRADPAAGLLVCCSPLPGGCCPHADCCLVHDGSGISVGPPVRSCARERGRDDGSPYPVRKVKFTGGWAGSRLPHDRIGGSGREGAVLPVCSLLSLCLACGKGIGYIIKGVTEALSFSGYSLFKGDCR